MELARVLRRSENEFVGVGSGLLDQFSSLFGRAGHALFLDCDTLVHDRLPLGDPPPAIIVCDSKTSRRLADGMYDQRRAECEKVAAAFAGQIPHRGEFRLSWVSLDQLERAWPDLDPVGRRRARHVLSENERVRLGVEALKSGDVEAFGRLMSASHASSRDDFENSSPALNALIEAAQAAPGFLGGKLSGAGWAGCTVNLVRSEQADDFAARCAALTPRRPTRTRTFTSATPRTVQSGLIWFTVGRELVFYGGTFLNSEKGLDMPWARMLADLIVVFHASYVSFVVLGLLAILVGAVLRWRWVRNFWFRIAHLAAIGVVVLESLAGIPCPLTVWESQLRRTAGQTGYTGDFIGYWVHQLIFYQAEPWVFTMLYVLFGLAVLAAFILAPPRWSRSDGPAKPVVSAPSR